MKLKEVTLTLCNKEYLITRFTLIIFLGSKSKKMDENNRSSSPVLPDDNETSKTHHSSSEHKSYEIKRCEIVVDVLKRVSHKIISDLDDNNTFADRYLSDLNEFIEVGLL